MPVKRKRPAGVRMRSRRVLKLRAMPVGRRFRPASTLHLSRANSIASVNSRVTQLFNMIETKEGNTKGAGNVGLPHNNIVVYNDSLGNVFNIFRLSQGVQDNIEGNLQNRIGDSIAVKGIMIRGFFECALQRAKVFIRVMLLKGAKGDTFDRSTIFKNDSNNKMIDQVNTERFTIVAQKTFNIVTTNNAPATVGGTGVPNTGTTAGIGTRTMKMWIPGRKFGRNGVVQYENQSITQVKFFDYRICILAYDWLGTPQDINNVGLVNELYSKMYFKDA